MRAPVRLGMLLLLLTDAIFFFFLILAFIYFRQESIRTAALSLDLKVTTAWTVCLAASSLSMWRAAASPRHRRIWLGVTIALGAVFFLGQGTEYFRILRDGIAISQGLFATTFFTLASIHGLHLLIGIVLLAILLMIGDSTATAAIAMYWYFVAAVWIVIFSIVYLWTFL
jgi:heme/copper-type cytochrome/quinol oxidase subunit 3